MCEYTVKHIIWSKKKCMPITTMTDIPDRQPHLLYSLWEGGAYATPVPIAANLHPVVCDL